MRALVLSVLLAATGFADTVILDGGDVNSIGVAYAQLNNSDGQADTILITTTRIFEPRPVTINGTDSLTIVAPAPCNIVGPNRLDLFRITARPDQQISISNLRVRPAWLQPKPADEKNSRRSIEPMHAAIRLTLSSELRNFSLDIRRFAISASRKDGAVPISDSFNGMDWHYRDGLIIGGRQQSSENVSLLLEDCEVSHVTESGFSLRSDHHLTLSVAGSSFVQCNQQGLLIDPAGKSVDITRTRVMRCTTGLLAKGTAGKGKWGLKRNLFAENRGNGIQWDCPDLSVAVDDCSFHGNGQLFGAAHSKHSERGNSVFSFSRCIFSGAGYLAPGQGDQITLTDCNFVLEGPQAMRGRNVPYPSENSLQIKTLYIADPAYASVDPFADSAFAVTRDGYQALGITGFADFAGGTPGEVAKADPDSLDTARRRASAPSERDAANWAWRYRMSEKPLHLNRCEAHFRGFLDTLQARIAKKPDYALPVVSARQACFALLTLRSSQRLKPTDEAPLRDSITRRFSSWTAEIERFPTSPSLLAAASCAMTAKAYPDLPQAHALKAFAESAWADWKHYGLLGASAADQTASIHALLDLAFALEKEAELRADPARFQDLSLLVNNAGLRRSPTDIAGVMTAEAMADYFRQDLPGGVTSDGAAAWSRLAWLCQSAEFAALAERVTSAGQPVPQVQELLDTIGVPPTALNPIAQVTRIASFANRMILAPQRGPNDSYLGAWLYERGNAYVRTHPDQLGNIYDFSSGGAVLLGHGTRRTGGTRQANTLVVRPPEAKTWQQNSASLAMMAGQFPSQKWATAMITTPRGKQAMWGPAGDVAEGYAQFNPDGYLGASDELALDSIFVEVGRPSLSRNELAQLGPLSVRLHGLKLAGQRGAATLHQFTSLTGLELVRKQNERSTETGAWRVREEALTEAEFGERIRVVKDDELGDCLELTLPPSDSALVLKLSGLNKRFDIRDDYDRLRFSHRLFGDHTPNLSVYLNAHQPNRYDAGLNYGQPHTWPGRNQGGQVREAETVLRDGDAWGHFRATNCYGVGSRWLRQCVVAKEGFAVVRDVFVGSESLEGFEAGPIWHLSGKEAPFVSDWKSRAWWQEKPPRLFVHIHGDNVTRAGRVASASSVLKTNKPVSFVSLLVPFVGDEPPDVSCEPVDGGFRVRVGERELILPEVEL